MAIKVSSPVGMRSSSEGWMQTEAVDSDLHKCTLSILITMAEVIVSESEKCYLTPALTKNTKSKLNDLISPKYQFSQQSDQIVRQQLNIHVLIMKKDK